MTTVPSSPVQSQPADIVQMQFFARQVIGELAEAIGPKRALIKLHARLGDVDLDPGQSPSHNTLREVIAVLTDWAAATEDALSDEDTVKRLHLILFGANETSGYDPDAILAQHLLHDCGIANSFVRDTLPADEIARATGEDA